MTRYHKLDADRYETRIILKDFKNKAYVWNFTK